MKHFCSWLLLAITLVVPADSLAQCSTGYIGCTFCPLDYAACPWAPNPNSQFQFDGSPDYQTIQCQNSSNECGNGPGGVSVCHQTRMTLQVECTGEWSTVQDDGCCYYAG